MKVLLKLTIIIGCMLQLLSCENFLEVPAPKDQIDIDKVFNNDKMAVSALMQVYTDLRTNGFFSGTRSGVGFIMGCYTDELEVTTTQMPDFRIFYQGNITSTNNAVTMLWKNTYKQIYMLNNIIEGVEKSEAISEKIKKQIKGEAMALRGVLHFYLTQTFENVPYVFTTDFNLNTTIGKSISTEVMNHAVTDLLLAEELLTDETISIEKVRINRVAVQAFLARIYLYHQNWDQAQIYALKVIENSALTLTNLEKVFLKTSPGTIWQLKPDAEGKNTFEAEAYIFVSEPAPQAKLSASLWNAFETDDLRKDLWLKTVGSGNSRHAYKYKQRGSTASSMEYSIIIRLEEMYLIAAESAAENDDWDLFNDMLNTIRSRAGLPQVNVADKPTAIAKIMQERRVELFCEFGHRFYDFKRRGLLSDFVSVKPNWQSYFENLPIPETELLLNPNLKPQNHGY
jgi:hypothetical protein